MQLHDGLEGERGRVLVVFVNLEEEYPTRPTVAGRGYASLCDAQGSGNGKAERR